MEGLKEMAKNKNCSKYNLKFDNLHIFNNQTFFEMQMMDFVCLASRIVA